MLTMGEKKNPKIPPPLTPKQLTPESILQKQSKKNKVIHLLNGEFSTIITNYFDIGLSVWVMPKKRNKNLWAKLNYKQKHNEGIGDFFFVFRTGNWLGGCSS